MTTDGPKSCLGCPSYLKAEDTAGHFRKNINAPGCARFGHILGKHGLKPQQNEKIAQHFASRCPSYGEPQPSRLLDFKLQVTFPDPDTIGVQGQGQELVSTCVSCANFVQPEAVAEELGWAAGACAAKGKLILPTRTRIEADGCEQRTIGTPRRTTRGMMLLPEFEDAFNLNYDPVRDFFKAQTAGLVDPKDYPTDKAVSTADQGEGIRAWRKVEDKDTGMAVYLPIYDASKFSEEERESIPQTGDDEHPELYVDHNKAIYTVAVCWTELDETPALWGPAGVGKTEFFRHMAWLMQLPFVRISVTGSTELDDLAGKMHFSKETGTYFEMGRLPKAWSKPCVICLDEPNVGQPDVWQFIRPLTDNSKQLVLDMAKGQKVSRHTDCYLGMAMNPAWDPRNVGAEEIGDADGSRLTHINMELPPPALEREILRERVQLDGWEIDNARLDTIMAIAEDVRGLIKEGTLPITWGVRDQIKVARATRWFDHLTAYRRARADALEPEAREALLAVVRAHVPTD
jgi:MoxR-like ATPase